MTSLSTRSAALCLALAAAGLAGCAAAVVGGAAAVGGLVAIDRRSPGTQVSDQTIELRAGSRASEVLGGRSACRRRWPARPTWRAWSTSWR